jgi:site-specific DNA-methyltransferase (adenine-specific)
VVKVGEILGRWPSNLLLDEEAAKMLDEQSGERPTGELRAGLYEKGRVRGVAYGEYAPYRNEEYPPSTGGASRFFYIAKASRSEREKGLARLPEGEIAYAEYREEFDTTKSYVSLYPDGSARPMNKPKNVHPTVKPVELMRYLVRLVTPKDGLCLDPFLGSGTTLLACRLEGFNGLGIEKESDYELIIRERLAYIPPPIESFDIEEDEQAHLGDGTIDRDRGKVH